LPHQTVQAEYLFPMAEKRTHLIASGAAVLGGALVVAGAALPWVPSGRVTYSAFSAARVVRELNLFKAGPERWAVIALLLTPVVVPLGLILLTVGWRRLGALALLLVGLLGGTAGALVLSFSNDRFSGPVVALVGGVLAVIASILLIVTRAPKAVVFSPEGDSPPV
jgi:hypothetical protein